MAESLCTSYQYRAVIIEVIDADTFLASVDLGFYTYSRQHFRLRHYYAPESDGREAPLGIIGTTKLREYLPVGKEISIRTEKTDSFGRWLADVDYDGVSLSKILSDLGYGVLRPNKKKSDKITFDPALPYPLISNIQAS
jgi:micrococcal nuclease